MDEENRPSPVSLWQRDQGSKLALERLLRSFASMYLTHINLTMPRGGEELARLFYSGYLGLRELRNPDPLRGRGGVWFDAGGLQLHLSIEDERPGVDRQRHFGLGCGDLNSMKARLQAAGVVIQDGSPAPWKRFFILDPFGNRIEIHAPGLLA